MPAPACTRLSVVAATLDQRLDQALRDGAPALSQVADDEPVDERDALLALSRIHALHTAPLERLDGTERWQHHPAISHLKCRLEEAYLDDLRRWDEAEHWDLPDDAAGAMRSLAALDRVPRIYDWLADEAPSERLVQFLALEGGPDGGFDDLVALCQVGLDGPPKLELARNYWDEMGRGEPSGVHTELYRQLVSGLGLPSVPLSRQPVEALQRSALGPLLATNRWLQPQMVGALGLIELQAGPRCRRIVSALKRVGAPRATMAFYEEHADTDPRHGRQWLTHVVEPLAADDPSAAARIVEGARWRSVANRRFFDVMQRRLGSGCAPWHPEPLFGAIARGADPSGMARPPSCGIVRLPTCPAVAAGPPEPA